MTDRHRKHLKLLAGTRRVLPGLNEVGLYGDLVEMGFAKEEPHYIATPWRRWFDCYAITPAGLAAFKSE
jgi:hypothetical protein